MAEKPTTEIGIKTIFENNIFRLEKKIRENEHNLTISRIKNRDPITKEEIKLLESILFDEKLKKEALEKELGRPVDLVGFITKLVGLSREKVDQSFADFINHYQLSSVQIEFLDTIKKFLSKNGQINPGMLYDAPFIKYHSLGVEGVFTEEQTDRIFEIIGGINESVREVG